MRAQRRNRSLVFVVGVVMSLLCALTITAQAPQTQEEKLEAANKVFAEGFELFQKGTAESLRAAIPKIETAKELFQQAGDKKWEAGALVLLGRIANDLDEKAAAIERYKEAQPLLHDLQEKLGELAVLNNIGAAYLALGENQLALRYFEQSLPLINDLGDKEEEARLLANIGIVYSALGDNQTALHYLERSLLLSRSAKSRSQEAADLANIGGIYSELGENQTALKYYEQVLPIARELNDKRLEAAILNNSGKTYSDLGENQKALEYYNRALSLRREAGDREGEAATLNNIGMEYLVLGEGRKALEELNRALLIRRTTGELVGEAVTLNNIMGAWRLLGNLRFAAFYGKQSVDAYQKLRSNIRGLSVELQRTYLKSVEDTYRHLAFILITEGRLPEAQQTLNSLKDQQFFDFDPGLRKQLLPLTQTPRESAVTARYERAIERVGVVGKQLEDLRRRIGDRQPDAQETAQLGQLESDLKRASDDFVAALKEAEIEFSKPPGDKDKVAETPDTREMQTALRELSQQTGQKTVAVYQFVGEKDFHLILITPEEIKSVSTPITKEVLQECASQFWAVLQSDKYDPTRLGQDLYNVIFKPLEKELPKDTATILWSLDGNLRYVPMAALYDGKQYLVERFNHVNFTRADRERMTSAVRPQWTATGLGTSAARTVDWLGDKITLSALPGVGEELRLLIKQRENPDGIFEGEALQDAKFTRAAMLSALKQKRPLVHIASHFAFRPGDEASSFLLLGDGTAFTPAEMRQQEKLFDGVELLTLSACNTAAQQTGANGREVDAFAELAQRLGANSVMATLWAVADNSTPWLMQEFYQTRQNENLTKAEALRRAQLALLNGKAKTKPLPATQKGTSIVQIVVNDGHKQTRDTTRAELVYVDAKNVAPFKKDSAKPFAHPYFWSPFILIGNWR